MARLRRLTLLALRIDDERSLRNIDLYARLKERLVEDRYTFRVLDPGLPPDWNRALFLNLGFWSPDGGGDVLVDERIAADVVAHVAWHHVASRSLGAAATTAGGLLLAESVASAFDLYLVGRLLGTAPRSAFLATQVPAMAEVAMSAGLDARAFARLLSVIAGDPDAAFSSLRSLLFQVATRLLHARTPDQAARLLAKFAAHPFHALLHHYNLTNWILFAQAHAKSTEIDPTISRIDRALTRAPVALDWLARNWLPRR